MAAKRSSLASHGTASGGSGASTVSPPERSATLSPPLALCAAPSQMGHPRDALTASGNGTGAGAADEAVPTHALPTPSGPIDIMSRLEAKQARTIDPRRRSSPPQPFLTPTMALRWEAMPAGSPDNSPMAGGAAGHEAFTSHRFHSASPPISKGGSGRVPTGITSFTSQQSSDIRSSLFSGSSLRSVVQTFACLVHPFIDEEDDADERCRKEIVMPPLLLWLIPCTYFAGRHAAAHSLDSDLKWTLAEPATFGGFVSAVTLVLYVFFSRRLPHAAVEFFVLFHAVVLLPLADWALASSDGYEIWPWGMLAIDLLLVIGADQWATYAALLASVVWVAVRSAEEAGRWGLWDWPHDAEHKHDAKGWDSLPALFLLRLIPIILIFVITQAFAKSLHASQSRMQVSVSAAEDIAMDLLHYDIQSASERVQSARGELPPGLHNAFAGLLENLKIYRPHIPQAALPFECIESEGTDSDTDSSRIGNPLKSKKWKKTAGFAGAGTDSGSFGNLPTQKSVGFLHRDESMAAKQRNRRRSAASSRRSSTGSGSTPNRMISWSRSAGSLGSWRARETDSDFSGLRGGAREATAEQDSGLVHAQPARVQSMWIPQRHVHDLVWKKVTLVASNVRGYLRGVRHSESQVIHHFHRELLTQMTEKAAQCRALTDGLSGDRVYASVNGAKTAGQHQLRGARLGWALAAIDTARCLEARQYQQSKRGSVATSGSPGLDGKEREKEKEHAKDHVKDHARDHVKEKDREKDKDKDKDKDREDSGSGNEEEVLQICCGVCTGEALCGMLGCESILRYSFVGYTAAWVHVLERAATRWRAPVIVNHNVKNDAETQFMFRQRDRMVISKPSHAGQKPQMAWEMVAARGAQATEEWMYQLQAQQSSDPWAMYNKAREAYINGRLEACQSHIDAGRGSASAASMLALFDQLAADLAVRPADPTLVFDDSAFHPANVLSARRTPATTPKHNPNRASPAELGEVAPPRLLPGATGPRQAAAQDNLRPVSPRLGGGRRASVVTPTEDRDPSVGFAAAVAAAPAAAAAAEEGSPRSPTAQRITPAGPPVLASLTHGLRGSTQDPVSAAALTSDEIAS